MVISTSEVSTVLVDVCNPEMSLILETNTYKLDIIELAPTASTCIILLLRMEKYHKNVCPFLTRNSFCNIQLFSKK
jgi:hypothetical protein